MFLRFSLPVLLLVTFAGSSSAQVFTFDGTVINVTPHQAPPVQAYLLLYVQENVSVIVPVSARTVVTINGRRATWRQLKVGDVVHVTYEGWARVVEARR